MNLDDILESCMGKDERGRDMLLLWPDHTWSMVVFPGHQFDFRVGSLEVQQLGKENMKPPPASV